MSPLRNAAAHRVRPSEALWGKAMRHTSAIPSPLRFRVFLLPSQNDSDAVSSIPALKVSVKRGWTGTSADLQESTTCPLPGFPMSDEIPRWLCSGRLLQQQAVVFEEKLSCEATRFVVAKTAFIRDQKQSTIDWRCKATVYRLWTACFHSDQHRRFCCGSTVPPKAWTPAFALGGQQ